MTVIPAGATCGADEVFIACPANCGNVGIRPRSSIESDRGVTQLGCHQCGANAWLAEWVRAAE